MFFSRDFTIVNILLAEMGKMHKFRLFFWWYFSIILCISPYSSHSTTNFREFHCNSCGENRSLGVIWVALSSNVKCWNPKDISAERDSFVVKTEFNKHKATSHHKQSRRNLFIVWIFSGKTWKWHKVKRENRLEPFQMRKKRRNLVHNWSPNSRLVIFCISSAFSCAMHNIFTTISPLFRWTESQAATSKDYRMQDITRLIRSCSFPERHWCEYISWVF